MRDFERLEELSYTVQSGLRSNEVIWAIDQALAGEELDHVAIESLRCGRDILLGWSRHGAMVEPDEARHSQSMLGGEVRVSHLVVLASRLDDEADHEKACEALQALASALEAVSEGGTVADHQDSLEAAAEVFAQISEIKLGQANGIVRARRERTSWLPPRMTSSSS